MKVFFTSSPRANTNLKSKYKLIYQAIENLGHVNVSKFLLDVDEEQFYTSDITKFYEQTISDLKKSEVCVFEVSTPSLAIGHLVSTAIQHMKPVIVLYEGEKAPFFFSGIKDDKLQVLQYSEDKLSRVLESALNYAQENLDIRFNFFIPPKINRYLDWIATHRKIPRSVFLRNLIESHLKVNKEYKEE